MLENLQIRNDELVNQNNQLTQLREKLYIQKDRLTLKMSSLNREYSRQKFLINDLQKQLIDTQHFLQEIKKDKEELIGSVQQKDLELRQLRKEMKELNMQVNQEDGAQIIIKGLKKKNESLQEEIMKEVKQKNNLARQLDSLEEDLQVLKLKNKDLTQHVSNLSSSVKKYEVAYNALQSSRDALLSNKHKSEHKQSRLISKIIHTFKLLKEFKRKMKIHIEEVHSQTLRDFRIQCEQLKQLANRQSKIMKNPSNQGQAKALREKLEIVIRSQSILKGKVKLLEQQMIDYKMKYAEVLNSNTQLEKANLSFRRNEKQN